jgi:diguanylate cyclase (GGDEF)-like protein
LVNPGKSRRVREGRRMRILIVDDDAAARAEYVRCFAGAGFDTESYGHEPEVFGRVACALSDDLPFAVAFVDSAGEGRDTLRRLRAMDPDLNLVAVTADPLFSAASVAGPVDKIFHIAKPFTPAEVIQAAAALRERWTIDRGLIAARAQLRAQVLLLEERRGELAEAEASAVHSATHDSLTGAPNRLAFLRALERRVRLPGTFAVAMLDLDRFKLVNDTLGHLAGDQLIREISAILHANVPDGGLVARLGGDEFGILFEAGSPGAGMAACARVVQACAVPVAVFGSTVQGGASAGVVVATGGGTGEAIDVVRRADLALNEAKRRGRGGVQLFDDGMDDDLRNRRRIEEALADALATDALHLDFLPIVDRDALAPEGFEAELRWEGSDPALFMPVAEESNLIHALGDRVLTKALAELAHRPGHYVSVNVSPRQFRRHDFAGHVAASLGKAAVAAPRLQLEISEAAIAEDRERAAETLQRLRAIGCRVALDDFGAGPSGLYDLRALALDAVKIDRRFLDGIGCDRDAAALLQAVIHLGRALGLDVVAQGVDTAEQVQALRIAGATHLQGAYPAAVAATGATAARAG